MTYKPKIGAMKLHMWYEKHPVYSTLKKRAPTRFCRICEEWRPRAFFIQKHGKSCRLGVFSDEFSYTKYACWYGSSPSYKSEYDFSDIQGMVNGCKIGYNIEGVSPSERK